MQTTFPRQGSTLFPSLPNPRGTSSPSSFPPLAIGPPTPMRIHPPSSGLVVFPPMLSSGFLPCSAAWYLLVDTGSDIGPCAGAVFRGRFPAYLLRTSSNVSGIFGDEFVDQILCYSPDRFLAAMNTGHFKLKAKGRSSVKHPVQWIVTNTENLTWSSSLLR